MAIWPDATTTAMRQQVGELCGLFDFRLLTSNTFLDVEFFNTTRMIQITAVAGTKQESLIQDKHRFKKGQMGWHGPRHIARYTTPIPIGDTYRFKRGRQYPLNGEKEAPIYRPIDRRADQRRSRKQHLNAFAAGNPFLIQNDMELE